MAATAIDAPALRVRTLNVGTAHANSARTNPTLTSRQARLDRIADLRQQAAELDQRGLHASAEDCRADIASLRAQMVADGQAEPPAAAAATTAGKRRGRPKC